MPINDVILAKKLKLFNNDGIDEFSDRLTYKFSSFILYAMGSIILLKQYFSKNISCYFASEVGGNYLIDYMESYCLVHGIIPITFNSSFPVVEKEWESLERMKIVYYQWTPLVLIFQGLMCYLPHTIWRMFCNNQNNKDVGNIISRANKVIETDEQKRKCQIIHLAKALETILFQKRRKSGSQNESNSFFQMCKETKFFFGMCKKMGLSLVLFYLFIKTSYVINAIGQIFLMQTFLGFDGGNYTYFGLRILNDIMKGKDWQISLAFPRLGFCFAKINHLGSINYVTAQCALPINMLNEKMYIFLWFWMVFLSIISSCSLIIWIIRVMIQKNKTDFIKMYLRLSGDYKNKDLSTNKLKKFENHFLRHDGIFILRMMASSAGDIITAEILSQLWKIYTPKYEDEKLDDEKLEKCFLKETTLPENELRRASF